MILLLLTLLAISTLSQDPGTCSDDVVSGSFGSDASQCICSCTDSTTASTCKTLAETKEAFACIETGGCTADQDATITELRAALSETNPPVSNACETNQVTFDSTATECTSDIIKCDQTSTCTTFNGRADPVYMCSGADDGYKCRQKKCASVTDEFGNTIATFSLDTTTEQTNDASLCSEICECSTGQLSLDDLCYYRCAEDQDGVRRLSGTATDIAQVFGDFDALKRLKEACKNRNDQLMTCKPENIVPRVVDDTYSKSRVNCGCGKCIEKCQVEKRYVQYKDDNGDAKCRLITCTTREETRTAATELSDGTKEVYYNIRRDEVESDVELIKCTSHDDDPTPAPATCVNPCAPGLMKQVVCVIDADEMVKKTFGCPREYKCAVEAANDATRYQIRSFGPCRDSTENACELTEPIWVTDKYVARSKCPLICKCRSNPDDTTKGNIEICDTMERNFQNIKKACATKFATACRFEDLYFSECPAPDDTESELCDKLFCDISKDPNDLSNNGVCRSSAEKFESSTIIARDPAVGCFFEECDKDENSETYNQLVSRRYDTNTVDSKGILNACPQLVHCKALTYDPNDVCNACPTCADSTDDVSCARDTLRKGCSDDDDACARDTLRKACLDDPDDDDTRDKPDGTRDEFKGKVRIKLAARFCTDEFFGYLRSEIYAFIKQGVYEVAGECSNIDVGDLGPLRPYISEFNYEITDKETTDTCDTMLKVVFRVDLCDIEIERLRKLMTCFKELKESDSVDIRASITAAIQGNTRSTRLAKDADSDDPSKTNTDGASVTASATSAELSFTDMDGNPIEYDVGTTEKPCENKDDCEGGGANGYSVVFVGLVVSFIGYFVY